MAVDASKLRRRRGLGAPPTEGAPGIEDVIAQPPLQLPKSEPAVFAAQQADADAPRAAQDLPHPGLGPAAEMAAVPVRPSLPPAARGRREEGTAPRQRVPPPQAESRVPFTARITLSTKERLEDACYHLRRKHQDFVNEAILLHLKKHGF